MMASVGLNVLCINNVNVHDPAQLLIEDDLPDLAKLAAIFRPFGVRLMVSIDYSQPMRHGIPTADPLDERVQAWWKHQAEVVYAAIPDLAGFLVKADSEHRPGPFSYGRNHAEGANMLARALKPFGGMLVWRCFVYNCQQDWRDEKTDRPKAAYEHYVYLDGAVRRQRDSAGQERAVRLPSPRTDFPDPAGNAQNESGAGMAAGAGVHGSAD